MQLQQQFIGYFILAHGVHKCRYIQNVPAKNVTKFIILKHFL